MMEIYGAVMRHGIMTWTYVSDGGIWCSDGASDGDILCGDEAWHYDMDIR